MDVPWPPEQSNGPSRFGLVYHFDEDERKYPKEHTVWSYLSNLSKKSMASLLMNL